MSKYKYSNIKLSHYTEKEEFEKNKISLFKLYESIKEPNFSPLDFYHIPLPRPNLAKEKPQKDIILIIEKDKVKNTWDLMKINKKSIKNIISKQNFGDLVQFIINDVFELNKESSI